MQILTTHLTRMEAGFICVAGLDRDFRHVRPVLPNAERLSTRWLARNGGPLDMGNVIDLGPTTPVEVPPEVEDQLFEPASCRLLRRADPAKFWTALRRVARTRLRELFGDELTPRGARGCGMDMYCGLASLGCLIPASKPHLFLNPDGKLRVRVSDGEFDVVLGVTDIRLYQGDHLTPDPKAIEYVEKRIAAGADVILSVGLTRPFAPTPDVLPIHWLQLNNVHLADCPVWQLG